MTNEEIELHVRVLMEQNPREFALCRPKEMRHLLWAFAGALVSAAYEEAAAEAAGFAALEPWYDTALSETGEAEAIAARIRALKDSLAPDAETAAAR